MTKRLCICLTEPTLQDCRRLVLSTDADLIEHRLDFMDEISSLNEIYSATDKPIIATCRSRHHGGNFAGDELERERILVSAIKQGASFVDIEIDTEHQYLAEIHNAARNYNCQLIISKHFTNITPDTTKLLDLVKQMREARADILKIVVTPKSISDCGRVIQLYSHVTSNTNLIAFAMGKLGKFTRIAALFLGAPFMYVSQDEGKPAAPGQISLSEMRAIVRSLL
ncbi:MAG: type I 3-dehydroquinate dehydratase [Candidatus Thorarchaeota archaeon]